MAGSSTISVTRGDTLRLHVDLVQDDGTEYELQDGDELTWTVRRSARSQTVLIQKHGQDVVVEPSDTAPLDFGRYRYDVQLTTASGDVCTVVKPADFIVAEEVTW